jgi:hypothetical protein
MTYKKSHEYKDFQITFSLDYSQTDNFSHEGCAYKVRAFLSIIIRSYRTSLAWNK